MKIASGRVQQIVSRYGLRYLSSLAITLLLKKIGLYSEVSLIKKKITIDSKHLYKNTVSYGAFKGMVMSDRAWWGVDDFFTKYTGHYERHVIDELEKLKEKYNSFIDIGAGDGFFAIGTLFSGMFLEAICFEISKKGREVIKENASLNGVSDKITIYGEATPEALTFALPNPARCLIICDIEGAEFSLFDRPTLEALQHSHIIIELHDDLFPRLSKARQALIEAASEYFDVTYIPRHNPEPNTLPEIQDWDDDARMLAFSESRPTRMEWVLLSPTKQRNGSQKTAT